MIKLLAEPSLSHRFLATFFIKRIPSPMDMQFQRISGLSRGAGAQHIQEGGENVASVPLLDRLAPSGRLTLERGVMPVTPVTLMFNHVLSEFASVYATVVILLLNEQRLPICSWTLSDALPLRWQTGSLDAGGSAVLIDTLELAYREMHWIGVRG